MKFLIEGMNRGIVVVNKTEKHWTKSDKENVQRGLKTKIMKASSCWNIVLMKTNDSQRRKNVQDSSTLKVKDQVCKSYGNQKDRIIS